MIYTTHFLSGAEADLDLTGHYEPPRGDLPLTNGGALRESYAYADSPENALWLTAMIHSFNDAMWVDDYNTGFRSFIEKYNARAQARAFLRGRTEGFHLICHAAGLDPDRIRRIARDIFGDTLDDPYFLLDEAAAEALLGDRLAEFVE